MDSCPCGSGLPYATCCAPYISGSVSPPTAEALMRSRYSAYAKAEIEYLYETSGPEVRREFDEESTRKWAESAEWQGFEVLESRGGGERDDQGEIEFIARYRVEDHDLKHHEVAQFERRNGEWRFRDGKQFGPDPYKRDAPKIGRNEPCPCGSGRKYKKCCGRKEGEQVPIK